MQRLFQLAILLPALALLPIVAIAQDAKKDDKPAVDEAKLREKAVTSGAYVQGKLTAYSVENDEKKFTIQYVYQKKATKPNPEVQKQVNALAQQMRAAVARKDAKEVERIRGEGQMAWEKLYDVEETPVMIEFHGEKNMVFRTLEIPVGDDGKPKKLTPAEQKELGADPKLPGLRFDPKNFDNDMIVRVYVDKAKLTPAALTKDVKDLKKETKKEEMKKDEKKEVKEEEKKGPKVITSTKKPEEKKPEEKKPETKKPAEDDKDMKSDKVSYPATMIVVVPPPMNGGATVSTNPFLKK